MPHSDVRMRMATTRPAAPDYSYRDDPAVPHFDDHQPILVFDGVCVLCSGVLRFVLRHDRRRQFRFATAQSPLGQALYRHYGLDPQLFETSLLLDRGRLYTKLDGALRVLQQLGGVWRLALVLRLLPPVLGERLYDAIARRRYRWFGRRDMCLLPDAVLRERFVDG